MKKTIILSKGATGRDSVLEQVMAGALSFGFVITERVKVFNSRKEAAEMLAAHPCRKGCKVYTLNKKQADSLKYLKNGLCYHLADFLKIK